MWLPNGLATFQAMMIFAREGITSCREVTKSTALN